MIRKPLAAAKSLYEKIPSRAKADGQITKNVLSPGGNTYSYLPNEDEVVPLEASYELDTLKEGTQSSADLKNGNKHVGSVWKNDPNPRTLGFRGNASTRMWNSIWLKPSVLIGFTAVFSGMLIATLLLYHFSEERHGLSTQISKNRYSWTYGPTAVLVVLVSLWRQVDYQCKALAPWQELRRGPSPADRSILLDYISPLIPTSLFTSMKNGHWAVAASTIGFLLLKLITVFSTGLLVLEPTPINLSNIPFEMTTKLDASSYHSSVVTAAPAQRVYGIQNRQLSYPISTLENLAIQSFNPPAEFLSSIGTVYTAEVPGFSTDLECEILPLQNATKKFLPWFSIQAPFFLVNITTDSCQINNAIIGEGADHGFYKNNKVTQNYQGMFQSFTCNTRADNSLRYPSNANGSDYRFLLSMVSLQWNPHQINSKSSNTWVEQLTGVLCKPTYSVDKYKVSYTQELNTARMQAEKIPDTNSTIEGFESRDLISAVQVSLKNVSFGQGGADYVVVTVPSFFQLIEVMNNKSSLEPFMNPTLLLDLGSRAFRGLSTQIANEYLMRTQNTTIYGSVLHSEERLQVKRLTIGLIAACSAALVCIGALVAVIRPWNAVPCEPESICSHAVILAASQGLRERLTQTGSATLVAIEHLLSQDKFQAVVSQDKHPTFAVEQISRFADSIEASPLSLPKSNFKWWRPIALQTWFGSLVIIVPLLLIALLEAFQHISDSHHGLIIMSTNNNSRVLSTYIPAFVMLCLATLYTSLDFNVSVFAPFAALRRGDSRATRSMMINAIGKLPPHALFLSIRGRHIAPCLTILAGFVSSFLTIVVSGLYSLEIVPVLLDTSIQQADVFNFTHVDLSLDDGSAGTTTDLIRYSNISYPQWTYDDLVFPSLAASSVKTLLPSNQSTSISLTVPAIRGYLDCSELDPESVTINAEGALPNCTDCNDLVQINYKMSLPYSLCGHNVTDEYTAANWSQIYVVPNDSSVVYAGKGTVLQWTAYGDISGDGGIKTEVNGGGINQINDKTDNSLSGCPSFSYSLGTASAGKKTKYEFEDGVFWNSQTNINIFYCHQRLQQVMTNVTFSYPDFLINSTTPPIPIESTAQDVTNSTKLNPNWFDISLNTLVTSLHDLGSSVTSRNWINPFIQALVWGKDGIPIHQLSNFADTSTLTAAANKLYAQYVAQAISANMRTTSPPKGISLPTHPATLTQPSLRLQQNRSPKIALQTMLAFMVACAIGAYLVADTKRVLPHNPCSIVGTMSLLADSEMCGTRNVIPQGSEWKSNGELSRKAFLRGGGLEWGGGRGLRKRARRGSLGLML